MRGIGARRASRKAAGLVAVVLVAALGGVVRDARPAWALASYRFGRVQLSAGWGTPGTAETIIATNFFPGETVTASYSTGVSSVLLCSATASASGEIVCDATIPPAGNPGRRVITARGATSSIFGRAFFTLTPAAPTTMAAVGDDLTTGFRASGPGDHPDQGWATGTDSAVFSEASRLGKLSPALSTRNLARTGATAADLAAQLSDPLAQGVDFTTVEIGFNDLCTPSVATMTAAATFDSSVKSALAQYHTANPNTLLLVASIPRLFGIRQGLFTVPGVQATWDATSVCPSLLSSSDTDADRQAVDAREDAFNTSLQQACAAIKRCRYDGGTVNNGVPVSQSAVSTVDDFHLGVLGQAEMAFWTMHTGWWPPLGGWLSLTPDIVEIGAQITARVDDGMPGSTLTGCPGVADATGTILCPITATVIGTQTEHEIIDLQIGSEPHIAGSAFVILSPGESTTVAPPRPSSIASAGDSFTQAHNIGPCCVGIDNPQYSWSTGTSPQVASHYARLAADNPGVTEQNVAISGAKIADLQFELDQIPIGTSPDYATILIGANDVCTPTIATMTDPTVFETTFRNALSAFHTDHPETWILVSSIPNVYRLWSLFHTNPAATSAWAAGNLCQSMLNPANSSTARQTVLVREMALNAKLAKVCNATPQCKWDGGAGFKFAFPPSAVSTGDYFHPSIAGQNYASAVEWAAGYWGPRS